VRPWITYLLIRLGIFAVVLAALLVLQVNPFLSAVIAAVASLVISYIFFRKVRDAVAAEFAVRNEKPTAIKNVDTEAEDAALDRLE
jgi:L-lactate permease